MREFVCAYVRECKQHHARAGGRERCHLPWSGEGGKDGRIAKKHVRASVTDTPSRHGVIDQIHKSVEIEPLQTTEKTHSSSHRRAIRPNRGLWGSAVCWGIVQAAGEERRRESGHYERNDRGLPKGTQAMERGRSTQRGTDLGEGGNPKQGPDARMQGTKNQGRPD